MLLCLLGPAPRVLADDALLGRVVHVADGDSLTLEAGGTRYRIRLHQIDAPEQGQPGSRQSRRALADKVAGKYVRVVAQTVDDYGRTVGGVWLGNRHINHEMVREGHAWAYRRYLEDGALLEAERAAREAGRGLWSAADPVAPWQWRQRARQQAAKARESTADTTGCRIKGNISRRGDRIYHRPGDRHYAQTRIDPSRGERWFCSEKQAQQAGWRAPRG